MAIAATLIRSIDSIASSGFVRLVSTWLRVSSNLQFFHHFAVNSAMQASADRLGGVN
jgi:hypothetical protein